jgi:hypothetical protein
MLNVEIDFVPWRLAARLGSSPAAHFETGNETEAVRLTGRYPRTISGCEAAIAQPGKKHERLCNQCSGAAHSPHLLGWSDRRNRQRHKSLLRSVKLVN